MRYINLNFDSDMNRHTGMACARTYAEPTMCSINFVDKFMCYQKLHVHLLRKGIIHVTTSQFKLLGKNETEVAIFYVKTLIIKFFFALSFVCVVNFLSRTRTFALFFFVLYNFLYFSFR